MPSSDLLQQAWSPIVEFAVSCLLRLHIVLHTLVGNLPLDALEGVIQLPSAAIGVMVHAAALHTYLEISYLEISYLELSHLVKCSSLASNEFQDQFQNHFQDQCCVKKLIGNCHIDGSFFSVQIFVQAIVQFWGKLPINFWKNMTQKSELPKQFGQQHEQMLSKKMSMVNFI